MTRKNVILSGLVLLCVGGIAYSFFATREDPRAEYPDAPESKITWMCAACSEIYELTPRELYDFAKQGSETVKGRGSATAMTSTRATLMRCPKCNEQAVSRALKCTDCDKVYVAGEGGIGVRCADCGKAALKSLERKPQRSPSNRRP